MERFCPKCFRKFGTEAERCSVDGSFLVTPMDRDLTGEVLDERYTVLEQIGRGGMGVVYKAEQHLIKRIVALKVLRREIVQDESAVKRFLNEARAIASLDSRHTVTLYDFGVTRDGLLYYTMELLKGRTLSRIIRDDAPLGHVRAAGLIIQACRSLEEAHGHEILHRDVKPENLFVVDKQGREELKVLDFGIAKLLGDASMDTVTRAGMIVGTPQYLSPEQAQGETVVPASDLYSLAIVFYELLAGEPPFHGDTPVKTMWAHIRDPVPPLCAKNPKVQVPRSIEAFLAQALEKEPGRRFRTAVAFREALLRALEDENASPGKVSLPDLSSTDQGLRLKTRNWEALPKEEQPPAPAPAETRTAALMSWIDGQGRRAASEEPAQGSPAPPGAVEPPLPSVSANEASGASAVLPLSETLDARGVPEKVDPAGAWALAVEIPEPDAHTGERPSEDSGGRREIGPGPDTRALVMPGRRVLPWVVIAAGALALGLVLALWAPWKRVTPGSEGGQQEPRAEGAKVSKEEAAPEAAQKAGEVAAVKVTQDAEAARKKAEQDAAAKAAADAEAARKKAEQDAAAKAVADAEAARKKAEQDAAAKAAADSEAARKKAEQDAAAKAAADAEAARKRAEQDAATKAAADAEAARKKAEQDAAAKKAAEEKAQRKAEEDAAAKQAAEKAARERAAGQGRASLEKGRKQMDSGRYEDAIASLGLAKEQGANAAEVDDLVRECYQLIRQREVQAHVSQGNKAYAAKDWDACVQHFQAAVGLGVSTAEVQEKLNKCKEMKEF